MPREEKSRDHQTEEQSPPKKGPSVCSLRYEVCLLVHFCNVVIMSQHACLSLTMVAMVNVTEPRGPPNASADGLLDSAKNPKYNWSPKTQGVILSANLYGVLVAQIPTGLLSGVVSVRKMMGCSLLLSSLLTLLVPWTAAAGETFVIACRALQGLSQGSVMTTQNVIWVKWAPPLERGRLTSLSLSGNMLGPFIALLATGFVCQALGWPAAFYIFGACGCALSLAWFALFHEDPAQHPRISAAERDFIVSSLAGQVGSGWRLPPLGAMLRSPPFWAINVGCFAFFWTLRILFLYSPIFIRSKLKAEVQENGLLSALPYLFTWIANLLVGPAADFLLARNVLSVLLVRKLFTTLGLLLPAIFSVCLAYVGSSTQSTMAFLVLASSAQSFCLVGVLLNPLDIAPRYYGFLKSAAFLIGATGGLISSTVAGIILDQDPESSWFQIFFLMAAINTGSLVLYLVFAKAEVQDWAQESQLTRF